MTEHAPLGEKVSEQGGEKEGLSSVLLYLRIQEEIKCNELRPYFTKYLFVVIWQQVNNNLS